MTTARSLFAVALAAAAIAVAPLPASAQFSTTATVAEFNGATTPGDGQNQFLSTTNPADLTIPAGWDFSAVGVPPAIGYISITLTLIDGNSGAGDFDFDHLFLSLDGVDTGLRLNGFAGGGAAITLTISGFIDAATSTALLTALADDHLVGTITTDNSMDTVLAPNELFVGNDTNDAKTTLTLAFIPEPGTYALLGLGLLLVLAPQLRRLRRNI